MNTFKKILIIFSIIIAFLIGLKLFLIYYRKNETENYDKTIITYSKLGNNGNFGNQLFQIACVYGLAEKFNSKVMFKQPWKYEKFFVGELPMEKDISIKDISTKNISEKSTSYEDIKITDNHIFDIDGYRQSEKYFKNIEPYIRKLFTFKQNFIDKVIERVPEINNINSISVHIRRGDYLSSNYSKLFVQCSPNYYLNALNLIKEKIKDNNPVIIICSDDLEWCKNNMENILKTKNLIFSPFSEDEDSQILDLFFLNYPNIKLWLTLVILGGLPGLKIKIKII